MNRNVARNSGIGKLALSLGLYLLAIGVPPAWAATSTWNGGGSPNGNWTNDANWGGTAPSSANDTDLIFGGGNQLATTNNIASPFSLGNLTFDAGAGSFSLAGSPLWFYGNVVNNSPNMQTVINAITLQAASIWNASAGSLAFSGAIANGGFPLTVDGAYTNTLSGNISGTGGLIKTNTGVLVLSGTGSYIGNTVVKGGTMTCPSGKPLGGTMNLTIQSGAKLDTTANGTYTDAGLFTTSNRTVTINGAGSQWVAAGLVKVGSVAAATNNTIVVTGSGASWSNLNQLALGDYGSANSLIVSNGGLVACAGYCYIGTSATSASNNTLWVTGSGSVWTNSSEIQIGRTGPGNSLIVSNGGVAACGNATAYFGVTAGASSNNTALVTGSGSRWSMGALNFGWQSPCQRMTVADGGVVVNAAGTVSASTAAGSNNTVWVTGAGSMWSNTSTLAFGNSAGGNSLVVSNGGLVTAPLIYLGVGGTSPNTVWVTGSGSTLKITTINVGWGTVGNSLTVSNGGSVVSTSVMMPGNTAASSNNTATVTGSGSVWSNSTTFLVGNSGGGNSVVVSDGAVVRATGSRIGESSSRNTVLVTGSGSIWSDASYLYLGYNGTMSGNSLIVSNGGLASFANAYIGSGVSGTKTNHVVLVTSGGVLEVGTLTFGTGPGNCITNSGGVYQFTSATPSITRGAGWLTLDSGVISFRNVTGVNITNNWYGNATSLTNITFSGANAFRLNNSTNSTTVGQSYVFDTGRGATNYAGLELVSGNTAYTNGSVTVGSGGWLTFSNTAAIMWGAVTNNGLMTITNSTVVFTNGLALGEGCHVTYSSNSVGRVGVNGALALPNTVHLTIPDATVGPGDQLVLFDAAGGITGSPGNWDISPGTIKVRVSGNQLVASQRVVGFIFEVQ